MAQTTRGFLGLSAHIGYIYLWHGEIRRERGFDTAWQQHTLSSDVQEAEAVI